MATNRLTSFEALCKQFITMASPQVLVKALMALIANSEGLVSELLSLKNADPETDRGGQLERNAIPIPHTE